MSIRSWLKRWRLDDEDLDEEIRAHLDIAADERMADGLDPQAARYAALRDFGNVTLTTEAARRVWTPRWVDALHDLASDVRYAARTLAKSPSHSLTVVGVLALGIGLNAAVFTMLKGIALSPIAGVEGSARLGVVFGETNAGRAVSLSYPDYQHLRDHDAAFAGLMGSTVAKVNLGRGRSARQVWAELVSGNYFQVLGVGAERGRTLLPSDEVAPGHQPVVVLSDGLWRRDFEGDPGVVGRTIEINRVDLTVVGVAEPTFHGTTVVYDVEAYIPVTMAPELGFRFGSQQATPSGILSDRRALVFQPLGRLRPEATIATAEARTDALWGELRKDRPAADVVAQLRVVPFLQSPGGAPTILLPTLSVLGAMALMVLLVACANIAGLVLVRGLSRRGEIAVRLALGATRRRVVRLLVVETLVLAAPAAVLGVLAALHGIPVLVGYAEALAAPDRVFFNSGIDTLVILFAVLVACASALVVSLVPALRSTRVDLVSVINEDASPRGAARGRLRAGLVVAQVAVSLMLLVGAGLAARSVDAARRANPGFDASHVTAIDLNLEQNAYDEAGGRAFCRQLLDAARAAPGVESATLATNLPLAFLDTRPQQIAVEGYEPGRDEDLAFGSNVVGPDYFRTLRIGLVAGRAFEDRDDDRSAPAAMVNHTLADRFWGGASNALGKRIRVAGGEWRTVVGVAADVKYARINEAPRPYVYLPFLQSYRPAVFLHTRGPAPIDALVDQARGTVAALDPDLPILSARPLAAHRRGAFILFDLMETMLSIFGIAGIGLAAMGTYGLAAYAVRQSTREIGIRLALGASATAVLRRFLGQGVRLGVTGAAIGTAAALGVGKLLGHVLFGVSATDGVSFARALTVVLGVVVVATIVPAWRAARTDPLRALRHH